MVSAAPAGATVFHRETFGAGNVAEGILLGFIAYGFFMSLWAITPFDLGTSIPVVLLCFVLDDPATNEASDYRCRSGAETKVPAGTYILRLEAAKPLQLSNVFGSNYDPKGIAVQIGSMPRLDSEKITWHKTANWKEHETTIRVVKDGGGIFFASVYHTTKNGTLVERSLTVLDVVE